jgi:hypothetical protein
LEVRQDELQHFNDYCVTLASTQQRDKTAALKLLPHVDSLLLANQ